MISYIKGTVASKSAEFVVVDVGGVGVEVRAPAGTIDRSPSEGSPVMFHTYLHVRDDAMILYGFDSTVSRDLFLKLLGISGFGAAKALAVLSVFSADDFETIVYRQDADSLTTIPGIGRKGAEKLLFEMKDKVGPAAEAIAPAGIALSAFQEAMEALVQLGLSRPEANAALKDYEGEGTVEHMLQFALKRTGKGR